MKRKYLYALIIGVLTTISVSTFTSCKDYSDDINNLQAQIDKASLATDVQTLKAQVEAAIASSTATADKAKQDIAANATNISNLDNDLKTLEGTISTNSKATAKRIDSLANAGKVTDTEILNLQKANKAAADSAASALAKNKELSDELTKAVKQWTDAKADYYTAEEIDQVLYIISYYFEDIDERLAEANKSIGDLKTQIDNYKIVVNALYTAVTEVSIVSGNGTTFSSDLKFDYGKVAEDLTFGNGETDDAENPNTYSAKPTKTYKKGAEIIIPTEMLIKVNPVNANITPSMIKLVDSKGETLDSLLEITKVEKYDEYLYKEETTKSRANIATGLWKVTLQPKANVDVEKNIAQTTTDGKSVLFAVAINNTAAQAESAKDAADRYVVSDYELTIGKADKAFEPATYSEGATTTGITIKGYDLVEAAKATATDTKMWVKNGEDVEISFAGDAVKDKIDCFYVAIDKKSTIETELGLYTFDGIDSIVTVNNGAGKGHIKVHIPEKASLDKINVPFRIFAINRNGKYYNKAGNVFILYVKRDEKQASVTADMNFTDYEKMETGWTAISNSLMDPTQTETATLISKNTIDVTDTDNHKITLNVEYAQDAEGKTKATKDSEVKFVKFSLSNSSSICNWTNGSEAKGTLMNDCNSLQVSLTKKMPTKDNINDSIKAKYQWTGVKPENGILTAYMYPTKTAFYSPFWGITASRTYLVLNEYYTSTSDNCYLNIPNIGISYRIKGTLYTDATLLVDSKTERESEMIFNFGKISSDMANDGYSDKDGYYKVAVETFKSILTCFLDEKHQTYTWNKLKVSDGKEEDVNYITYGDNSNSGYATQHVTSDASKPGTGETWSVLNYIQGHTTSQQGYHFDHTLNALIKGDFQKYKSVSAKLITDATGVEDYFNVSIYVGTKETDTYIRFKPIYTDAAHNPAQDVPSKLVFTCQDAFTHTHTIEMPFTVKRR